MSTNLWPYSVPSEKCIKSLPYNIFEAKLVRNAHLKFKCPWILTYEERFKYLLHKVMGLHNNNNKTFAFKLETGKTGNIYLYLYGNMVSLRLWLWYVTPMITINNIQKVVYVFIVCLYGNMLLTHSSASSFIKACKTNIKAVYTGCWFNDYKASYEV